MLRSALLNVMIKAARKASRTLKRDFGEIEHLQASLKGPANFVTAADLRAEEILRDELEHARPGYGFLGEEGGAREGSDKTHRWIVDPLDGTLNFLHGIPHFAISIGCALYSAPRPAPSAPTHVADRQPAAGRAGRRAAPPPRPWPARRPRGAPTPRAAPPPPPPPAGPPSQTNSQHPLWSLLLVR